MTTRSSNGFTIDVRQTAGLGSTWVVRVYRKMFLFKKALSSDWFLDGGQAHRFAEQLEAELGAGKGIENIRNRKPGWTLHRPDR